VRLRSAEAERRQAKHDIRSTEDIIIEMLRNARDAHAHSIFVALSREGSLRRICMLDDGDGIPESMQERIFDPRVTSKLDSMHMDKWGVHGRGMALYSITENASVAKVVASTAGMGSSLFVETDLTSLPEKTDQSSVPVFSRDEDGVVQVRGPRNINRMVGEFAFEHRELLSVYCGSATDIAATLYEFGLATVAHSIRAFTEIEDLPIVKRLCTASDPASFVEIAQGIGLEMSERSARRIMDGTIQGLSSVADDVTVEASKECKQKGGVSHKKLMRDARGLKISDEDLKDFSKHTQCAFGELAKRYYLEADIEPEIRVTREGIQVFFPIAKLL
ncbi:MAG: ATP-binding protein, partial [Raoultibacter sp.]